MARGDGAGARAAVARLVAQHPAFAPGWLTASLLELQLGQAARALDAAERGLAVCAGDPALLVQRARCLLAAGAADAARAAVDAAELAVRGDWRLQHELSSISGALGDYERGVRLLAGARVARPEDPALARDMAVMLRFLGRFDEAEACLDVTIRQAPQSWDAYPVRSQLRRQTVERNHVSELEAKLRAGAGGPVGQAYVHYALAKEFEDLDDWKKSFAHLSAGATLCRRGVRYDVADDVGAMERIAAAFGPGILGRAEKVDGDAASIFVFGLPRSGTTLVDRILGCHPDVTSLGELTDFPSAVTECAGGVSATKQDLIEKAALTSPAAIGAAYLARVARLGTGGKRFIDKLPINYLYAGWIAAALPGAKLVHVVRHPMANGYGLYKTLFQQGYPFSYDLDDLGRYIAAYLRLMAHWEGLLGERLIRVDYETLVRAQERESRRLISACGLEWDDACLAPQKNAAPSLTQSAVQVRAPVNTESVDQWRRFSAQLAPLADRLRAEGVEEAVLF
jgi:tetratricopeptide (TPR) repeat protein